MGVWTVRATGPAAFDEQEARRALAVLADPDRPVEIAVILGAPKHARVSRVVWGHDLDGAMDALRSLPGGVGNYFCLNPLGDHLGPEQTPADEDVACRRWFPIDLDRRKAKDDTRKLSATHAEKEACRTVALAAHDWLAERGWPAPLLMDSGNGYWLLYRIDLPNDEAVGGLVRGALKALAKEFDSEAVKIDTALCNAARLAKLPGTWARKGEPTTDRPHRMARLLRVPAILGPVTAEQLAALADGTPPPKAPPPRSPFRLHAGSAAATAWARKALENVVGQMCLASPGELNEELFRCGAALGNLVGGGHLTEAEVFGALLAAGQAAGCDNPAKDADTLRRAIQEGMTTPRHPPGQSPANGYHAGNGAGAAPAAGQRPRPTIIRLSDLMAMELPPPRWVVPGLLSEGLTILAGKPKLGKSWMALNIALTVAAGGKVLGDAEAVVGDVLYLSLEDKLRRVQDRAKKLLAGKEFKVSDRLHLAVEWARQDTGGLEDVDEWADSVPDPRLVIVDVWQRFRPPTRGQGGVYEQDYAAVVLLKAALDRRGISGIVVHHCKKAKAEDALEEISGTNGLAGAADGVLVLSRARSENEGTLFVTGRDTEEQKLAVEFDPQTFAWKSLGDAEKRTTSVIGQKVLAHLQANPLARFFPSELATAVNADPHYVRNVCYRLAERGAIARHGSKYTYPPDAPPSGEQEVPF